MEVERPSNKHLLLFMSIDKILLKQQEKEATGETWEEVEHLEMWTELP